MIGFIDTPYRRYSVSVNPNRGMLLSRISVLQVFVGEAAASHSRTGFQKSSRVVVFAVIESE
jgi:hypothetical protein